MSPLGRPNYSFQKRQKELAKKQKREEKAQRKLERAQSEGGEPLDEETPEAGEAGEEATNEQL
ncbi:MAG: hypothetical protein ACKVZ0_12720 [Gemmatimonadales bacterium]